MTHAVTARPILATIRELLRFKDFTTIAEIASMAGLPRKKVLEIVNKNGPYVYRNRANGRITRIEVREPLRKQLWESGKYFAEDTYGAYAVEGHSLKFHGNDELRDQLKIKRTVGGLGDNYEVDIILDTPENRAAIQAAGLQPWSAVTLDDRLWEEPS